MELALIIGLIVWLVSTASKGAKRKQAGRMANEAKRPPEAMRDEPTAVPPARPTRPVDVDLPGQTTMPIHWEGTVESPVQRPLGEGESTLAMGDRRLRPSDYSPGSIANASPKTTDTQPVSIPGLNLELNADSLVKGVIFSEILTRRPIRRPR